MTASFMPVSYALAERKAFVSQKLRMLINSLIKKKTYIRKKYKAIVIGTSNGGMATLTKLLPVLPHDYPIPVTIVQHLAPLQEDFLIKYYNDRCALTVKEADEKEENQSGYIYFAPPNYHLLIEKDKTFSLSIDKKVNFVRPSIDVLFESAVDAYLSDLIGIILTGANIDGVHGLEQIKMNDGLTIVQDPATAESSFMPQAAIDAVKIDYIMPVEEIGNLLLLLGKS